MDGPKYIQHVSLFLANMLSFCFSYKLHHLQEICIAPNNIVRAHVSKHKKLALDTKQYALYYRIESFLPIGPTGLAQSSIRMLTLRSEVYSVDVTWKPTAADRGLKTLCSEATDAYSYVAFIPYELMYP